MRQIRIGLGDITRWRADAICTSANAGLCGNRTPSFWRFRVPEHQSGASSGAGCLGSAANRTERRAIMKDSVPYVNVDGAVHAAAGPELQDALAALIAERGTSRVRSLGIAQPRRDAILPESTNFQTACRVGSVVVTPAFGKLLQSARMVVHAVAPDGRGHHLPRRSGGADAHHALLRRAFAAAIMEADAAGADSIAIPALGCGVHCWGAVAAARAALEATDEWLRRPSSLQRVDFVLLSDDVRSAWEACARGQLGEPSTSEASDMLVWQRGDG